jgi:hypothetical protein
MKHDPQQHGKRRFWDCVTASWAADKGFWEHTTLTLLKPLLLAESVDDPWESPPPNTPSGGGGQIRGAGGATGADAGAMLGTRDVEAYARSFGLEWPEAGSCALLISAIVQGDLPMVSSLPPTYSASRPRHTPYLRVHSSHCGVCASLCVVHQRCDTSLRWGRRTRRPDRTPSSARRR